MLRDARSLLATEGKPDPTFNIVAVHEVGFAARLVETWRDDPSWPETLASLKDPRSFAHAVAVSMTASAFREHRVVLRPTVEGRRTADLRVEVDGVHPMNVEVKSPAKLQVQRSSLDRGSARELVEDVMKQAGQGTRGQLEPSCSALLSIGGFHLGREDMQRLRDGIERFFEKKGARRKHVVGIMTVTMRILVDGPAMRVDAKTLRVPPNTETHTTGHADSCRTPTTAGRFACGGPARTRSSKQRQRCSATSFRHARKRGCRF